MTQEVDWISSQAWVRFYETHAKSNPQKLLLQFGNKAPEERFFAEQLAARAKAKGKWDARWFEPRIIFPPPVSVEQASSSATARYKATLASGLRGIDITGGFGIDSFALSHSFKEWIYVERNKLLCERAAHNFKQLNRSNIKVMCGDGPEMALTVGGPLDLIFADPSRRVGGQKVIHATTYEPDLSTFHQQFLKKSTAVLYKLSPMADIQEQVRLFQSESAVTIVEHNKECKELLMHWHEAQPNYLSAVKVDETSTKVVLEVALDAESQAQATYSLPQNHLYEPHVAVVKAGVFKFLSQHFHLNKIHNDSHLYTSNAYTPNFPGRIFRIEAWGSLGQLPLKGKRLRVASKNHPLTPEALRKKYKLLDGNEFTLFATTLQTGKRAGILCKEM